MELAAENRMITRIEKEIRVHSSSFVAKKP
jgi:hypothetical protein